MHPVEVDRCPWRRLIAADSFEQACLDLSIAQLTGLFPSQTGFFGAAQVAADGGWRYAAGPCDLAVLAAAFKVQTKNFSNLSHG